MARLLDYQKRSQTPHNTSDPALALREQLQEASTLLERRGDPVDASSLFVALMSTPYLAEFRLQGTRLFKNEQLLALTFASISQPLPPYQVTMTTCECSCADLSDLKVEKIHLSGSVREYTHVRFWSEIGSDVDAMFQIEPVRVFNTTSSPAANPNSSRTSPGIELRVETTPNRGYVLLKHMRRGECHHPDELSFSADRAVSLLGVFRARLDEGGAACREGPALNTQVTGFYMDFKSTDLVPCVTAAGYWSGSEFAARERPSGQPSRSLARRLAELPVFLVPVGVPGSATERDEWRVSFTRHEYIVLRNMSQEQRSCLTLLKTCKALLGLKGLKSYHLKTALMWLCETRPREQWTTEGTPDCLLLIITYLEDAMCQRRLRCFFWPEMNILATRDVAQLSEISSDLLRLKSHLLSCSLALVTHWLSGSVPDIADRLLFSETPLPRTDGMMARLLTDTFLKNVLDGRPDLWGYLRGLFTSVVINGSLPMSLEARFSMLMRPTAIVQCYPMTIRSVKAALKGFTAEPWDGLKMLYFVLKNLIEIECRSMGMCDGEDSWMV